jgi:hypothetical protein
LMLMDLKPLDLVWVESLSTCWTHPCELTEFGDIPGLAIQIDAVSEKKRPLLSQVSLPSHRLPPSEFDPAPTLALYARNPDVCQDKSIALQLSLFPSAIYCHVPGGDRQWKAALQLERDSFIQTGNKQSMLNADHFNHRSWEKSSRTDIATRRSRSTVKPVICEFRRTSGLMPQLSRYLTPSGRNMVIRFVQDEDIDRPRH